MRLAKIEHGHRLREKVVLWLIAKVGKRKPPDVLKTLLYRPRFFGRPFSALTHAVLRGPSDWSVGERELFAAFVSRQNQCVF